MSKSKKKCEFPNEEYVHDCPYSHNFKDIRCSWYDGECPRYSKKEVKKNDQT